MKRLTRIIICLISAVILGVCSFGLAGCEDIKKLQMTVTIYDAETSTTTDKVINIDLYRHLAPTTVDAIIGYVNRGLYNGCVFYQMTNYSAQIMMGDFKFDNGYLTENEQPSTIRGEFEKGGVIGSNLKSQKGSVGLWRTWPKGQDIDSYKTTKGTDTGRATWFLPVDNTNTIGYNGCFCIFAVIDLSDGTNSATFNAINTALSVNDANKYETYVVYYTGEYNPDNTVKNNGLTYHCVTQAEYDEMDEDEKADIFEPTEDQYVCYELKRIKLPIKNKASKTDMTPAIMVKSVAIK